MMTTTHRTPKNRNHHTPKRAERLPRVKHEHVLTLPRNGRKGCALCPYVEPRAKLVMPEHMKADRHAKGPVHPNNSQTQEYEVLGAASPLTNPTGMTPEQLHALTVPTLYALAQTKNVRGRGKMNKEQLVAALSAA
jgi:hypothetical protein